MFDLNWRQKLKEIDRFGGIYSEKLLIERKLESEVLKVVYIKFLWFEISSRISDNIITTKENKNKQN